MDRLIAFTEACKRPLPAAALVLASMTAAADTAAVQRVRGYFCDAKADQISLLAKEASGDSKIIAANEVNKQLARQSCAYYLPVSAIALGHETVFSGGLVFRLERYVFLPEKVERWSGTALGSLQETARAPAQDI
jgi:hypothetical protein